MLLRFVTEDEWEMKEIQRTVEQTNEANVSETYKEKPIKRYLDSCCNCSAPLVHMITHFSVIFPVFMSIHLSAILCIWSSISRYGRWWFWRTQLHQIIYYRCCNKVIFHSNAFRGRNSISIVVSACVWVRVCLWAHQPPKNLINNRTLSHFYDVHLLTCSHLMYIVFLYVGHDWKSKWQP